MSLPPSSSSRPVAQPNGAAHGPKGAANDQPSSSSNPTPSVSTLPPEAIALATRLFEGARQGDVALFEQVLAYNSGMKDMRNDKGDSLVMLAAYHGRLPLLRLLLSHGADPNSLNDRQQSPLAGAIFKGEKEVVEALSDAGADWGVGEPSAREAVRIFRQEAIWGDRMGGQESGASGRGNGVPNGGS